MGSFSINLRKICKKAEQNVCRRSNKDFAYYKKYFVQTSLNLTFLSGMSPRHHKCWEALSPASVEEPPSVGDGGYLAIKGV